MGRERTHSHLSVLPAEVLLEFCEVQEYVENCDSLTLCTGSRPRSLLVVVKWIAVQWLLLCHKGRGRKAPSNTCFSSLVISLGFSGPAVSNSRVYLAPGGVIAKTL